MNIWLKYLLLLCICAFINSIVFPLGSIIFWAIVIIDIYLYIKKKNDKRKDKIN